MILYKPFGSVTDASSLHLCILIYGASHAFCSYYLLVVFQILSSVNLVIETTKADPGEEADIVVTDSPDVYMTVSKEMEAITLLDKAVALWEDLDEINDVPMFLQSLIICSRQYELLKKVRTVCLHINFHSDCSG